VDCRAYRCARRLWIAPYNLAMLGRTGVGYAVRTSYYFGRRHLAPTGRKGK